MAKTEDGAEEYGERYVLFTNHKIDLLTFKLLSYVLPLEKLSTMKLSNNNLSAEELKCVQNIVGKDENMSVVFFEWNPIPDTEMSKSVFTSLVRPNLKSLILRSSKIGDEVFKCLVARILEQADLKLKHLDLYDNQLTPDCVPALKDLLLANKPI